MTILIIFTNGIKKENNIMVFHADDFFYLGFLFCFCTYDSIASWKENWVVAEVKRAVWWHMGRERKLLINRTLTLLLLGFLIIYVILSASIMLFISIHYLPFSQNDVRKKGFSTMTKSWLLFIETSHHSNQHHHHQLTEWFWLSQA